MEKIKFESLGYYKQVEILCAAPMWCTIWSEALNVTNVTGDSQPLSTWNHRNPMLYDKLSFVFIVCLLYF